MSREQREHYLNLIGEARKEYDEIAKREVQKAFVYSFEESARTLLNNYLDNVEAYCNNNKMRDQMTDEEVEPDETLMKLDRGADRRTGYPAQGVPRRDTYQDIEPGAEGAAVRLYFAREAAGGHREEAVRGPAGRGEDHDVDQDARPGAVAPHQRGDRQAGRGARLLHGVR